MRARTSWWWSATVALLLALTVGACATPDDQRRVDVTEAANRNIETPPGFGSPKPRPAQEDVVGSVESQVTKKDDTLLDLAVDHDLGYLEIVAANPGIDPWVPSVGTEVLLPKARILPAAARQGIVINIPERRLYYYERGHLVHDYPVGIGRDGLETPFGKTKVVAKREAPAWRPTPQARRSDPTLPAVVPPGPDNPLGSHALYLGWSNYLIHGTNRVYAIGRRASRGCIRLYPDDIVELFKAVPVGTPVAVINQPYKLGWKAGELYLEAHPTVQQGRQLEEKEPLKPVNLQDVRSLVVAKVGDQQARIDWTVVETAVREHRGIPTQITKPATVAAKS